MTKIYDYELIYNHIVTMIRDELKENEKIPSENVLSEKFNISRATVRQGINKLKTEGLIYSKKGSGNFVAPSKIEYTISPYTTFNKEILKANKIPTIKFLEIKVIKADALIAKKLNLKENDDILYLKIVRYVDNTPFLFAKYYINISLLKNIQNVISNTQSISDLYINKYNLDPIRESSEIDIIASTEKSKEIFGIQNNLPLIKISTKTTDQKTNNTIDYCYSYFRSDMAKIVVNYKNGAKND
jgi:DNA-binding GntR family transcriptional regulator